MTTRWTYAFVDRPVARFAHACDFWTGVTGTDLSELRGERREFVSLLPSYGTDACVKVQAVASGPGGAHLDFCVDDVREFAKAAQALGAHVVADHGTLVVLRSPAGLLFCADPWRGQSARPRVFRGSRLDQVCLDVPPSLYDAEVAFWSALLPAWESRPGALPEFHVLVPPPGLPVRVLLQRLEEERPASAHLDLACADIRATRAEHERLGAEFVTEGRSWTVMRDPAGGLYCLTGRDPETGGLPSG
ncbi:VOC family protein [Streptomyces griseorubiginosus]|uniref:VOC family protein n=1 Tax=Streptomyces griseorubiginosus TaxID=67304 RepID=UPI002E809C0C|nr:VOC family protein [Streptomyces griseorubiginosus]WUB44392.1 VOC family protein [Streptomyces griseorubiginosus]WUB52910.1 VOC family protein [Streptomyces griseorubiginosus]